MVRELNKVIDPVERIKQLEKAEQEQFEKVQKIREKDFRNNDDELDTAFYFSVVFNSRSERDAWLKKHNIELVEDFFVKADDFNI